MPTTHREPLCLASGVTNGQDSVKRCLSRRYPTFIARMGSCARPKCSCRLRVALFRQVFAGCGEPLLHDGLSRRYLCDPCMSAWVRTPPQLSGARVRFFPLNIGLSLGSRRSACERVPQHSFTWGEFSGLQPFGDLQALILAWPTGCSDRQGLRPFGHWAVYTGQYLRRYRSQAPASLRVRTGQLTRQDLQGFSPLRTCWIAALSAAPSGRKTARAVLGQGLAVSAFPRYVPV